MADREQYSEEEPSTTSQALTGSGMTCSSEQSGNGYWFYCSGSRNVKKPWLSVTCSDGHSTWSSRYTYPGTMYGPFSFGHFQDCGPLAWPSSPNWGPR